MLPVDQRGPKDCLRACIASVFEIPWEDAPDTAFEEVDQEGRARSQENVVNEWLKVRGLVAWRIDDSGPKPVLRRGELIHQDGSREPSDYVWPYPFATHCLGGGPSPRSDTGHAVVMHLGKIVHDPHPDKDMTIDRITSLTVFCARLG